MAGPIAARRDGRWAAVVVQGVGEPADRRENLLVAMLARA
jgi:hypothetical protein